MRNVLIVLFLCASSCAASMRPPSAREDRGMMTTESNAPVPLHWNVSRFPIEVRTAPDFPEDGGKVLDALTADLNKRIGVRVFSRSTAASVAQQVRVEVCDLHPVDGSIYVYRAQFWNGRERTADTVNYYESDGEITAARVRLPEEPDDDFGAPILLHELGHVMGLDHDDQGPSIMSPTAGDGQRLTDHDLALLRAVYRVS